MSRGTDERMTPEQERERINRAVSKAALVAFTIATFTILFIL